MASRLHRLLDDVRVYDTSLSEAEVLALFNQPVLALRFDEDAGWPDHNSFGNDGACEEAACPDHGDGIVGGGASFNGANCLRVGPDASLDLSAGRFSIAAWVYPQSGSGEAETILGAPVEGAKAYPRSSAWAGGCASVSAPEMRGPAITRAARC